MAHGTVPQPVAPAPPEGEQQTPMPPRGEPADPVRRFRALTGLCRCIPTLVVMALLAGLGALGHRSGWKLPKFSALAGNGALAHDDWCEEHAVPESQCVECNPDLWPQGADHGWCREHGVHNCPLHHPEVAQLKQPPLVSDADRARAARALAAVPRAENNPLCKNYRRRIQFASLEDVRKAGVEVGLVDRQPIVESIAANGQITYDQTRFANLSSRLPGAVWRVEKNAGDQVRSGEVLALVDAAEVGRAKMELIHALAEEELARRALQRLESLTELVPGRQVQESRAAFVQARARLLSAQQALYNLGLPADVEQLRGLPEDELAERLRFLGIPENQLEHLSRAEATANLLPLKAPMGGMIVARQAVAGEVVDASRVLFQLADTSRMWLMLNVSAEEAGRLALGQPVHFRPDGNHAEASGETRMVAVRAELDNPRGQLRNETFGTGRIVLREEQAAIAVPNEAIHWEGCCHVVFVRDRGYFDEPGSPKVFHVRTVRLGAKTEKCTEIIAGLLPGEVVATKGSDVLRAELLKNSLGEGCCEAK